MGDRRQTPDDQDVGQPGQRNLLSGQAHGPIIQAGAIHGDVTLQPAIPDTGPVVPRQLLPAPARFAGRTPELALLRDLAANASRISPTVVVLRGPGGVGKTALAPRPCS